MMCLQWISLSHWSLFTLKAFTTSLVSLPPLLSPRWCCPGTLVTFHLGPTLQGQEWQWQLTNMDFRDVTLSVWRPGLDIRRCSTLTGVRHTTIQVNLTMYVLCCVQVSARGEVTVTLPPKLELHCPVLAVANKSLEVTLVSWGALGVDVDWKITKDGVQVAKG